MLEKLTETTRIRLDKLVPDISINLLNYGASEGT